MSGVTKSMSGLEIWWEDVTWYSNQKILVHTGVILAYWNINRHQILYTHIHPQLLKMCCIVYQFEISSVQVAYSRAACFMPVVLLTGFCRGRMRMVGIAKCPEARRRAGALSCTDVQGEKVLGRYEGTEVSIPCTPGIQVSHCAVRPLSLEISRLCQTFRKQVETAVVTSGMTQMSPVVQLSN